ncbi:unnamed protein product [Sphenostylis stenocarpa]|uniref:Uncharacterized protein n=1 Tax=Sphenostylis stenocarpa TaxID=92480 RepID=A0AA86TP12_9FABA|nr:unnamed protein product [Sphenostylis stenocarpa]
MSERKNKVYFTEEDAVALMQRYDPTTVFTLLQEVAHYAQPKIDWSELVKKSATGISNVREYQMLWRHLAYRHSLPENFEVGAEPLDDDSDLECELEALPPVNVESASEAAACVKVMIASRTLSESAPSSSTIEAPLTINVPVCHSSRTLVQSPQTSNLMQGTNIVFPVTVQRQTLPTHPVPSIDGIETKGIVGGNLASKRKRKTWSEEEDMQLRAAVQRWGEGNWATMAKGDNFPIKRSPTQLAQSVNMSGYHQFSQRWSILRKKDGSVNSGTISTSTQYTTAEQLATRHSLSLALDMPFKKLTAPGVSDPGDIISLQVMFSTGANMEMAQSEGSLVEICESAVRKILTGIKDRGGRDDAEGLFGVAKRIGARPMVDMEVESNEHHGKTFLNGPEPEKNLEIKNQNQLNCDASTKLRKEYEEQRLKTSTSVKTQVQIRNTAEKVASSFVPPQQPSQQASLLGSSDSHVKPKFVDEKLVLKGNIISNPVLKSTSAASGTRIDSPSNTISQFKIAPVKHTLDPKPPVSSLTKPSISTNLPSDPKNKPVPPLADKVQLKQDANSSIEFRVSDPGSTLKEKAQENEPPKVTIGSQVNSNLEKGRLDIGQVKIMPLVKISDGEDILKDKPNPEADEKQASATIANEMKCEDQRIVKNVTENCNLDKGSLNLDQDKKITSTNESSNNQNMTDKNVNLPVQDERSQSTKVEKPDGEC